MSDLAFTRLVDLVDAGYHVDRQRSSQGRLVLEHMGGAPTIELLRCGTVLARDALLWPRHFSRPDRIEIGEDTRFAEFIYALDVPSHRQEFSFHVRRAGLLVPMVRVVRGLMNSVRWHLAERHRDQ